MSTFFVVILALVIGYLLLRYNKLWIYIFDRSLRNGRNSLPKKYEVPRYFELNKNGEVNTSVKWPGWDGWYSFTIPDDKNLPVKMIRASLMTGLYGLDGVDNYEKLMWRLSSFEAIEHLTLIPTEDTIDGKKVKENYFTQHYLPKATDLIMKHKELDTTILGTKVKSDQEKEQYGRIRGSWPNYKINVINPEAEIHIDLNYTGENIVWWADVPYVFTYFAAFGKIEGSITYKRGTSKENAHELGNKQEVYPIKGSGCFEHGFARKPFNFDLLWLPIRLFKNIIPSFKPVRYHYELFIGDGDYHGGFMLARGFTINWRNQGGIYLNGKYIRIKRVKIEYLNDPAPDLVDTHCQVRPSRPPVTFYRRWKVRADTEDGILEYTGTREWPPAAIARNMMYYNFSFEGRFKGEKFTGRGYGEYLHI